jgi:hypothetical protein
MSSPPTETSLSSTSAKDRLERRTRRTGGEPPARPGPLVEKGVAGDGCDKDRGSWARGGGSGGLLLEGGPTTSAAGDWTARAAGGSEIETCE